MAFRAGYIFARKIGINAAEQERVLAAAGIEADNIWRDRKGSRSQRQWLLDKAVMEGGVLVVASPEVIGDDTRDRAKFLRALARQGASVQVVGGEPVLCDTPAKVDAFTALAGKAALRAIGARAPGRPSAYADLTVEQLAKMEEAWGNLRGNAALERVAEIAGRPVSRGFCRRKFGESGRNRETG